MLRSRQILGMKTTNDCIDGHFASLGLSWNIPAVNPIQEYSSVIWEGLSTWESVYKQLTLLHCAPEKWVTLHCLVYRDITASDQRNTQPYEIWIHHIAVFVHFANLLGKMKKKLII